LQILDCGSRNGGEKNAELGIRNADLEMGITDQELRYEDFRMRGLQQRLQAAL
jgi:hypothetical protein